MRVSIDVDTSGPIFSRIITESVMGNIDNEVEEEITDAVYDTVMGNMRRAFRDPRPYYWTKVTKERSGAGRIVTDTGIVYGPWLEGTGSRNRTTRFKGYFHWRRAYQAVNARAHGIAARIVARRIVGLGG